MSELHDLTALEQAGAIRRREVSPVELAEHYLARSERLGPTVGAFIALTPELALDQARAAEAAVLAAGDAALPVLHGVVVPVKDLTMQAGQRARFGSAAIDVVLDADDNVVAALRAGGAVMTGRTNTPEFGLPCYTENAIAPPARSPWDLALSAGGSSGGAAAAVGSGLAPVAEGSDGGGSIRIPAASCGLVGLKPSRGRVSNGPLGDSLGDIVASGPLARTVADAAALLDVMAVPHPDDLFVARELPAGTTFVDAARREPPRLRIGRYAQPVIIDTDVHPDALAAYEAAGRLLEALGHDVVDTARPFGPEVFEQFAAVWSVGALLAPVPPEAEPLLMPLTRWLREEGRRVTGAEVAAAVSAMRVAARASLAATHAFDVVLTPALAGPPLPVGALRDDADPAADFVAQCRFTPFTSPYNITGQPAIVLPVHWSPAGLPLGVQLVGRPGGEALLLSLAAQLEAAVPEADRPWSARRPEVWDL